MHPELHAPKPGKSLSRANPSENVTGTTISNPRLLIERVSRVRLSSVFLVSGFPQDPEIHKNMRSIVILHARSRRVELTCNPAHFRLRSKYSQPTSRDVIPQNSV